MGKNNFNIGQARELVKQTDDFLYDKSLDTADADLLLQAMVALELRSILGIASRLHTDLEDIKERLDKILEGK